MVEEQGTPSHAFGMAFIWFGFQLSDGRFVYLEDLYLEEPYRKRGAGSLVMKSLAEIGQSIGCNKLFWQALDWNTPALTFYNKIGATVQKGVITTRYAGDTLKTFARGEVPRYDMCS